MQKKMVLILEIIFVVAAITYYVAFELIPEYKTKYGSSDKIFNAERYKNMIEFKVDENVNFALIIDSSKLVYHIMFFDKASIVLYNKDIENHLVDYAVDKIFQILIEKELLNNVSTVEIVRYEDVFYSDFLDSLKSTSTKYNLSLNIVEKKKTLEDKALELDVDGSNILSNIDYYSKDIQRKYKNNSDLIGVIKLDDESSKKLCNNVYMKIEEYVLKNNIKNLEKNNSLLNIGTIPADENLKFYPNQNSWYYVTEGKVYSYIELVQGDKKYGYCYDGSIDSRSLGECVK